MPKQSHNPTPTRTMRRPGHRMTKEEREVTQEQFLKTLSLTANIRAACMAAGVDRSTVYYWQEHDETFSMRFQQANTEANDLLLAAAWERGVKGYDKPVVSMGKQVFVSEKVNGKVVEKPLTERVYSDNLLSLLLKARLSEFQDRQLLDKIAELEARLATQEQDRRYQVIFDIRQVTKEERETLEAIHDRIRVRTTENA